MSDSKELAPIDRLKVAIASPSVQEQFKNAMAENSALFVASLIDAYGSDNNLMRCAPALVIKEALKAATLRLPINKDLGFAYIIPYDKSSKNSDGSWNKTAIPQMQIGYKGFIQLAIRTGQYRFINADVVYEGESVRRSRVSGEVEISGEKKSDTITHYFAYFETINGFSKALCWSKEEVTAHAQRFSQSFATAKSPWKTNFDAMAKKTLIKNLLSKYGIMSVQMERAMADDRYECAESEADQEIEANANKTFWRMRATDR